ncbi:unnamed protein product [Calicophoron daubneyi]|uniref:Uncharacterized protein n=1 Tax=Calicophoron daubneyi TaxID=300641 RepID=A0AAV2T476_CALDB
MCRSSPTGVYVLHCGNQMSYNPDFTVYSLSQRAFTACQNRVPRSPSSPHFEVAHRKPTKSLPKPVQSLLVRSSRRTSAVFTLPPSIPSSSSSAMRLFFSQALKFESENKKRAALQTIFVHFFISQFPLLQLNSNGAQAVDNILSTEASSEICSYYCRGFSLFFSSVSPEIYCFLCSFHNRLIDKSSFGIQPTSLHSERTAGSEKSTTNFRFQIIF